MQKFSSSKQYFGYYGLGNLKVKMEKTFGLKIEPKPPTEYFIFVQIHYYNKHHEF